MTKATDQRRGVAINVMVCVPKRYSVVTIMMAWIMSTGRPRNNRKDTAPSEVITPMPIAASSGVSAGLVKRALRMAQPQAKKRKMKVVHQKERVVCSLVHSDFKVFRMAN